MDGSVLEGWESRTWPTSHWETIWDEASFRVCVCVCVSGLKASFIIFFWKVEEPFMFVSEEISLNCSGYLIRSFWDAFCFIHGVLNTTSKTLGKAATVKVS